MCYVVGFVLYYMLTTLVLYQKYLELFPWDFLIGHILIVSAHLVASSRMDHLLH